MWKIIFTLEPPTIFDERFKATFVSFFNAYFNLLSSELDNLLLTCYVKSLLY